MIRALFICVGLLWAGAASAVDISLPAGSRLVSDRDSAFDSYDLPVGPWELGLVETQTFEGQVERQSWRVDSAAVTTLQMLDPLRAQLAEAGYETVFDCADVACGGFDFRFAIEVIPAPDMHVDIRDYRFVAATSGDEAISLLVSRSRTAGYVQIIQVGPAQNGPLTVDPDGNELAQTPGDLQDLTLGLIEFGHVALSDLEFASGTAELSEATYGSLRELADFMRFNPQATLALVGHTDATGALDANIALSKRRAEAVRQRMINSHGLDAARLSAEGMGYLAPRASNLTQTGRERNRRVEAILLSLE